MTTARQTKDKVGHLNTWRLETHQPHTAHGLSPEVAHIGHKQGKGATDCVSEALEGSFIGLGLVFVLGMFYKPPSPRDASERLQP